jgi:hypothetical protein
MESTAMIARTSSDRGTHVRIALGLITAVWLLSGCGVEPVEAGDPVLRTVPTTAGFPTPTPPPAAPAGFTVFDTTFYTNVDLVHEGAVRANLVYETRVAALGGQSTDTSTPKTRTELALPPQDAYEQLIRDHSGSPGPIILDFESLYLRGSPDTAQRHFDKLSTLLAWAHRAAPAKMIGFYGILGSTAPEFQPLARQLAAHEDAFFPSLYTRDDDRAAWRSKLAQRVADARAINPATPVYPFIWPEYYPGTPLAGRHVPADYWEFQLSASRTAVSGVVIWSTMRLNADRGWVEATRPFLTTS